MKLSLPFGIAEDICITDEKEDAHAILFFYRVAPKVMIENYDSSILSQKQDGMVIFCPIVAV
jgi:hypothetical protein